MGKNKYTKINRYHCQFHRIGVRSIENKSKKRNNSKDHKAKMMAIYLTIQKIIRKIEFQMEEIGLTMLTNKQQIQ